MILKKILLIIFCLNQMTILFASPYSSSIGNSITTSLNNSETFLYNPSANLLSNSLIYIDFRNLWQLNNIGVVILDFDMANIGIFAKKNESYNISLSRKILNFLKTGLVFDYNNLNKKGTFSISGNLNFKSFFFIPFNRYFYINGIYSRDYYDDLFYNNFAFGADITIIKKIFYINTEYRRQFKENVFSCGMEIKVFKFLNVRFGYDMKNNFGAGFDCDIKNLKFIYAYNRIHYFGMEFLFSDLKTYKYRRYFRRTYRQKKIGSVKEAKNLIRQGKYIDALEILRKLEKKKIRNKKLIRTLIKKCIGNLKFRGDDFYKNGVKFYFKGAYYKAKEEFEKYILLYPDNYEAKEYIKKCRQNIKLLKGMK